MILLIAVLLPVLENVSFVVELSHIRTPITKFHPVYLQCSLPLQLHRTNWLNHYEEEYYKECCSYFCINEISQEQLTSLDSHAKTSLTASKERLKSSFSGWREVSCSWHCFVRPVIAGCSADVLVPKVFLQVWDRLGFCLSKPRPAHLRECLSSAEKNAS